MKFTKTAMAIAACALLASCSNDLPVDNGSAVTGSDSGYASFMVNLPTVSGTDSRAVDYDQGEPEEYGVANGRVLVFLKNANEMNSTYVCSSDINGMNWSSTNQGEISTTSKGVARLDNLNMADDEAQYGAIVVLNYNNDFIFPKEGETLGAWARKAQSSDMTLASGSSRLFTMTSAPEYKGSGLEPVLLADINKDEIYQSEGEASASAEGACNVFVQRNLAKVTCVTSSTFTGMVTEGSYSGDQVEITGWGLDLTNKTSFAVQVTDGLSATFSDIWKGGDNLDRFFGNGTSFRRVFWGIDPNYDKEINTMEKVAENFNMISEVNGKPSAIYALENTFDVNHQLQGQTSRVVIKADYTPMGMSKGETFIKLGSDTHLYTIFDVTEKIAARAKVQQNSYDVTVLIGDVAKGGFHSLSDVEIKRAGARLSDSDYNEIAEALGLGSASEKNISTYEGGVTYYVVRVKHFGDAETPWSIGQPTYGNNSRDYLGRYGMVRNNWYEVNITRVAKPGSPEFPGIDPEMPDDENEYNISVAVNLLSWAKRVHNTEL